MASLFPAIVLASPLNKVTMNDLLIMCTQVTPGHTCLVLKMKFFAVVWILEGLGDMSADQTQ